MDADGYGRHYARFLHQLRWISKLKPLSLAYRLAILSANHQSPYVISEQRVKRNISRCISEQHAEQGWTRFMQHTGVANCNIFRMGSFSSQWISKHVEVKQPEYIAQLRETDKPILLMIYHQHHPFLLTVFMGELLGRLIQVLAMTPKNTPIYPYVGDIYEQYFVDCAQHYNGGEFLLVDDHPPLTVTRRMAQTLKNKQLIVSLNDIDNPSMGKRNLEMPFYNSTLSCPIGAVEIALRHDVEFVAAWVQWLGGSQFRLEAHPIDPSQGLESIMQQYIHYLQMMLEQDAGLWEGWKFFDF